MKQDLYSILNAVIKDGEVYKISNLDYLELFGIKQVSNVKNVWHHLYMLVKENITEDYQKALEIIFKHGTLSTRIVKALNQDVSVKNIELVYNQLAKCLEENKLFIPIN